MSERATDLVLALVAASALLAAALLEPAGDGLALPGGGSTPVLCWLRAATGIECPSCGLTRSFVALLHGDLAASLRWHPSGPLLALGAAAVVGCVPVFALRGSPPLWQRPRFVRLLTSVAVFTLIVGLLRAALPAGG